MAKVRTKSRPLICKECLCYLTFPKIKIVSSTLSSLSVSVHEFLLDQILIPSSRRPRQPYAKRRVAAHSASTECFQCSAFCGCRPASFSCGQHRQAAGPCSPSCANNCAKLQRFAPAMRAAKSSAGFLRPASCSHLQTREGGAHSRVCVRLSS